MRSAGMGNRRTAEPPAARVCDEDYPPIDGAYQGRTYGRRLSLDAARSFWGRTLGSL